MSGVSETARSFPGPFPDGKIKRAAQKTGAYFSSAGKFIRREVAQVVASPKKSDDWELNGRTATHKEIVLFLTKGTEPVKSVQVDHEKQDLKVDEALQFLTEPFGNRRPGASNILDLKKPAE